MKRRSHVNPSNPGEMETRRDAIDLEDGLAALVDVYQPLDAQLTSLAALSYTTNATKVIAVNAGETGFELVVGGGGGGASNLDGGTATTTYGGTTAVDGGAA